MIFDLFNTTGDVQYMNIHSKVSTAHSSVLPHSLDVLLTTRSEGLQIFCECISKYCLFWHKTSDMLGLTLLRPSG